MPWASGFTAADATGRKPDPRIGTELATLSVQLHDVPFAFRIRVDEDAVQVKDFRLGLLGSPYFTRADGTNEILRRTIAHRLMSGDIDL